MKFQLLAKRSMDIFCSLIALILLFIPFVVIIILIKIDSRGPIFFKHQRAGKNGKPFNPYKFRTMKENAVKEGLGFNIEKDDKRITKLGNFLRNASIDELPQAINVLKGEMSLIGPRPSFIHQIEKYNDFQKKRLFVKPGITGLAITKGRNALTWEERIKYDVWYIEHWSLWLDFKILFQTVINVLLRRGLYGKDGINDDPF